MAEAAGFIAVYSFNYRDVPEEWSQGYHIADHWVDEADFRATMDTWRVLTEDIMPATVQFERFIGYQDRSLPHDYVYDVSSHGFVGAFDPGDCLPQAGDTAAWVRWQMARHSSRGKPVYLRKYFHAVFGRATLVDKLCGDQYSAMLIWAGHARDGSWDGHVIADKNGVATIAAGMDASEWLTTRTLERRGRRRPPP